MSGPLTPRQVGYLRALHGQQRDSLRMDALSAPAQEAYVQLAHRGLVTIDHRHVRLTPDGRQEATRDGR